jgi:hypothetical protein
MKRFLFRPVAFFGTLIVILGAMVALTLSRATFSASDVGTLKCYEIASGKEKAC